MGLSYSTVQDTYKVFNILKEEFFPKLNIKSWPEDGYEWSEKKKKDPPLLELIGWDKKSDDGWENIFFVIKSRDVPEGLKERFEELAQEYRIGNSRLFSTLSDERSDLFIIGWF
ncbi:hypothetical protein [Flavobacterium psychrotrophum]|uniref:hypothetical protein n=1 Tax=Flavobacterium psychrotrophum TaxID=2294119 RepID=UPI000E31BFA4|nr:hypothetical protein [Flavobacterium psychrotrophum]